MSSFYSRGHWHIRTTNPIDSTVKTKGCLSRKTALAMAFKLILTRRHWRKLDRSRRTRQPFSGKITKHAVIAPSPTFGIGSIFIIAVYR